MKKFIIFILVLTVLIAPLISFISIGLQYAIHGWATNPSAMLTKILFSFLFGQAIFWVVGYDQFGLFMNPVKQLGFGQKVAEWIVGKVQRSFLLVWTIKILEIITDAGKIVAEGYVYIRFGFAPDALATLVTQPLFSTIETAEKISGAILSPKKVNTDEQLRLSIGCIYGSFFRYLLAAFLWFFGSGIYQIIGIPVEALIRLAFKWA